MKPRDAQVRNGTQQGEPRRSRERADFARGAVGRDILETSRHAVLESAANLLATAAHVQRLKRRAKAALEDRTRHAEEEDPPRDFLYDMLRLHAGYLNELAKLGKRHQGFAERALENIYATVTGNARNPSANGLEFDEGHRVRTFVVQNDIAPNQSLVTLEWTNVLFETRKSAKDPLKFSVDGSELRADGNELSRKTTVALTFGIPKVITVAIDFSPLLPRVYRTEIVMRLELDDDQARQQLRRIPVTINARKTP